MVGRLLLNAIPEQEEEIVYKEVTVEDAVLESYSGKYELMAGFVLTIAKNDSQLKLQASGQEELSIIPISQDAFHIKGVGAQLTININEAEEVGSMTLHQNGQEVN